MSSIAEISVALFERRQADDVVLPRQLDVLVNHRDVFLQRRRGRPGDAEPSRVADRLFGGRLRRGERVEAVGQPRLFPSTRAALDGVGS